MDKKRTSESEMYSEIIMLEARIAGQMEYIALLEKEESVHTAEIERLKMENQMLQKHKDRGWAELMAARIG